MLFDHVGAAGSDLKAYNKKKYSTLGSMPMMSSNSDVLSLTDAVFVGHSISSMKGMFGKLGTGNHGKSRSA